MKRAVLILSALLCMLSLDAAERRLIVLRAEFADVKFSVTQEHTDSLMQDAKRWLDCQFAPKDSVTIDLGPIVTLKEDLARYGTNSTSSRDAMLYKAVIEACEESDPEVDFRSYDYGSNGRVDNVYIIMAGQSEAEGGGEDCIWPRHGRLKDYGASLTLDGRKIDDFCVCTETSALGTFCHEYMHSLGLPDFYDTDDEGSGGLCTAMWGSISTMDLGCENCGGTLPPNLGAAELEYLGLGECLTLEKGAYILQPIAQSRQYVKAETGTDGEFYLFECRDGSLWDAGIGGSGMLITHVDRSESAAGWSDYYKRNLTAAKRWELNEVNCRPDRPCAQIIAPLPTAANASEAFFPAEGADTFQEGIAPLAITDIRREEGGAVSFNVIEPVKVRDGMSFQDAVILSWTVDSLLFEGCRCTVSLENGEEEPVVEQASGVGAEFTHTLQRLSPGTSYPVTISVTDSDGNTFSTLTEVSTKTWRSDSRPYIWLSGAERNADGSFVEGARIPLRVYNAPDAVQVRWTMDGTPVSTGTDGFYTITGSGELKAEVVREDGGTDIIIKKIIVK